MKLFLLLLTPLLAFADPSYTTIGNTTFGSDGTSYTTIGNTTYGSDGSSATHIGSQTFITPSPYATTPVTPLPYLPKAPSYGNNQGQQR